MMGMSLPGLNLLVEGPTDEAVMRRVLAHLGICCQAVYGRRGKSYLLKTLPKYNEAARFGSWLVVLDLDRDASCAPEFVRGILPHPSQGLLLRVAVRAIESWLLADQENLAGFLGVAAGRIPQQPDALDDPKSTLVDLARKSRKHAIREDMAPRPQSGAKVGPGYPSRLVEFVRGHWQIECAMQHSDSLSRCVQALRMIRQGLEQAR